MVTICLPENSNAVEIIMNGIDLNSVADISFQLKWESHDGSHLECLAARGVNLWRDWLPESVRRALMGRRSWEQASAHFKPGELFGSHGGRLDLDRKRFSLVPQLGRFYPQGRLNGVPGVFPQNIQPFRCVALNNGRMGVEMSHPLAGYPLTLSMTVGEVAVKESERGGSCVDWVGLLTDGPGMQARWQGQPTDFFSDRPFDRKNEQADSRFYENPRLVHHLDATAREMVADIYKRFVRAGVHLLDLMGSWVSHLPQGPVPDRVSGLGMNRAELEQNPQLSDIQVHDLNAAPVLPYTDSSFDVAICTVSVEYLTQPLSVFAEVGRVLKPGGVFVVTFSNRWFPPKVVRIWEQLHEFERVGLVMEYFLRSGRFSNISSYSMRGLPRPRDDKYAGERTLSDPVFAVWGTRTAI
jgi:SAM-dependent methyltransferase